MTPPMANSEVAQSLRVTIQQLLLQGQAEQALLTLQRVAATAPYQSSPWSEPGAFEVLDGLCAEVGRHTLAGLTEAQAKDSPFTHKSAYLMSTLDRYTDKQLRPLCKLIARAPEQQHLIIVSFGADPRTVKWLVSALSEYQIQWCIAEGASPLAALRQAGECLLKERPRTLYLLNQHDDPVSVAAFAALAHQTCERLIEVRFKSETLALGRTCTADERWSYQDDRLCDASGAPLPALLKLAPVAEATATPRTCTMGDYMSATDERALNYLACVTTLMSESDDVHLHVGLLNEALVKELHRRLTAKSIPKARFIHVPIDALYWLSVAELKVTKYVALSPEEAERMQEMRARGVHVVEWEALSKVLGA